MPPRNLHKLFSGTALLAVSLVLVTACGRRAPRSSRRPPLPPSELAATPTSDPKPADADAGTAAPAPGPQLSDTERKAAARAAYTEGVQLQEHSDCVHALPRFETAQRLYDAPTHLLHIAQCQVATGRLIEAQESYATLGHLTLNAQAPAAFRQAQDAGRAELTRLKPRIPNLRIDANPAASSLKGLLVQINGTQIPADLVGVTRPMNPGTYRVTMTATPGRTGTAEVELKEGETKALEVRLSK